MINKNTMGICEYLFFNICWAAVAVIWHFNLFHTNVRWRGITLSEPEFLAFFGICLVLGIALTISKRRNGLSIFATVILPVEIYCMIAYFRHFSNLLAILLTISTALSLLFVCVVMFRRSEHRHGFFKNVRLRIRHSFLGVRTLCSICLAVFLIPLAVFILSGHTANDPLGYESYWDQTFTDKGSGGFSAL